MQAERWQRCLDIVRRAVDCPQAERAALLELECDSDQELRRKVELLLKHHDESGDFIEAPAFTIAPELLVDNPDHLIDQRLEHYRVDSVLGVGGMGVVYRAEDERLGRKVALKLLPQSLVADEAQLDRLRREARTASALNHPNIVTIHEIAEADGIHYIATEFIDGVTLRERMGRGPVPSDEAGEIVSQIASALSVAHAAGIVHRDIKPENVMLRPDGYVKVLDFGIAKFTQQPSSPLHDVTTQPGVVLGTTRYMSPEQARGHAVDARTDIWSLGVVLYEMLAGGPPFAGETPTDVMAAVLLKEPAPLDQQETRVPPGLNRIVETCLRKDPGQRYQTAEELLAALRAAKEEGRVPVLPDHRPPRRLWQIAVAAIILLLVSLALFSRFRVARIDPARSAGQVEKAIAVLPFDNLGGAKEDAFFADGIHDDVLTTVGKIKDLKVVARASVMDYRGAHLAGKIREIGQALGVTHILEGSVRRSADRVVVNVSLIDARDERQVWSNRYERTVRDTLTLQGELAVEIARELRATLSPEEASVAAIKPTDNADAYLAYLRARETEVASYSREEFEAAIALYEQAISLDPNFALAHARLSLCASVLLNAVAVSADWKTKARSEAEEALRLQPALGEGHLALTQYYLWGERDFQRALTELTNTAQLLPNSAEVPLTAAYIYKQQNRWRDRVAALERAEALDPRNQRVVGFLTLTYRWLRNWPKALATFDRYVILKPDMPPAALRWMRASDEFRLTGDLEALKKAAREDTEGGINTDWLNLAGYEIAMFERNYSDASRFVSAIPADLFTQDFHSVAHSKAFHEALVAVAANSDVSARERALELARNELEGRLSRDRHIYDNELGVICAFLGRKEDALREARRAVELVEREGVEKNDALSALALVYAQTGEHEKAIDLIDQLLKAPIDLQRGAVYNMTLVDLKWRWVWDPLRSNPRFQKILARPEPPTVY